MISDAKHQADGWAKLALDRLQQDDLPPTPENYTVYYTYFAGLNPNLRSGMDAIFASAKKLSQQQCTDMFHTFLGLDAEYRLLQESNNVIESELKRLLGLVDNTSSGAENYNKSLTTFSGALKPETTVENLRAALTKVAAETKVMAQQNQKLQEQLAQSTEQLAEVRSNLDQAKKDSLIDPLTEVGNRKYFNNELARATAEAKENNAVLSLLVIDIDFFKKFNDTYGHLIGDQVLRLVSHTLVENLKGRDVIARYGGEEFVILLPHTQVVDAERVGNQLRTVLATKQIRRKSTNETLGAITISIGATEYIPGEELDAFVARADAGLYEAKQTGRNKVMIRMATSEEKARASQSQSA